MDTLADPAAPGAPPLTAAARELPRQFSLDEPFLDSITSAKGSVGLSSEVICSDCHAVRHYLADTDKWVQPVGVHPWGG